MTMNLQARTGAVLFILWGILHVAGGAAILIAVSSGPEAGYAVYQQSTGTSPPLAGAILGDLAFSVAWIGALVAAIGATLNWRNSPPGLALNTALAGLTDLGLVIFLAVPGFVTWPEAAIGLALFAAAALFGGLACRTVSATELRSAI